MGSQEAHYIPLSEARPYVQQRLRFVASNAYGVWYEKLYVVWIQTPEHYELSLFVYDEDVEHWFENTTRYSVTKSICSRHRSQLHPHTETISMNEIGINDLIMAGGYKQLAKRRING